MARVRITSMYARWLLVFLFTPVVLFGQQADLVAILQPFPPSVYTGEWVTITSGIRNVGPDDAQSVVIAFGLGSGNFYSNILAAPGWSCVTTPDLDFVRCSIPVLQAGAEATFSVRILPRNELQQPQMVGAVYVGSSTTDPQTANNFILFHIQLLESPAHADLWDTLTTERNPI